MEEAIQTYIRKKNIKNDIFIKKRPFVFFC